ncbi:MAG TPA: penicillin acylase family protein, partial [Actinomycetota bacterium]|nr:penicillin acylase family protein [Actinomycetota bacterium]
SAPGYDVAGVALPFSPGVVTGHNERIAWGVTNSEGDVQDLYLERLSAHGTSARFRQGWEPVEVHREEIRVRHREEPVVVESRETRHGPLVDSYTIGIGAPAVVEGGITRSYALRWVGFTHAIQPSAVWALNVAQDWGSFREAARRWTCPGQGMVYADVDGNIGFQLTGVYPVRRNHDGTLPVPGWTGDYEWRGEIPFEDLPHSLNPREGFLVTANNRPHDDSYPHLLGKDFLPPFRARRIAQLLAERELHDRDSFSQIQMDTVSLSARSVTPSLLSLEPEDDRQKAALELLAGWDGDLAADSAPAALYQAWASRVARVVLQPLLGDQLFTHLYLRRQGGNGFLHRMLPSLLAHPNATWYGEPGGAARDRALRTALDGALDELEERFGDEPWRWGAMHRVRFAGRLALIPGLRDLFTAGVVEMGGDDQTVLQGLFEPGVPYDAAVVPSWRHVLEPGAWDDSVGVLTTGQSGHAASPHFNDQLELWASGGHHPMPFSRAAVEAAEEARFSLVPMDR